MSLESFQLNGKNALVTGSHKGLGAAIAIALAEAGANVGWRRSRPNRLAPNSRNNTRGDVAAEFNRKMGNRGNEHC
jgi:NAD(P)-dependent dehydrogenase (short-subunit alcohol dehydrogenase family)